MRGQGSVVVGGVAVLGFLVSVGGCVSLDDHNKLRAAHRNLLAQQESLQQELYDARSNNDAFRARAESLEREVATNSELLANLRRENELLDQMRRTAQSSLEEMAKRPFGDVAITGPKLPEPLHTSLKRFADEHPEIVAYDEARGTVKWKSDLLFPLGSDVVRESSKDALRQFTQVLMSPAAEDFEAIVVGHTDTTPIVRAETKAKHPTNWHLSAHRAISVGSVLQQYGYASDRIGVMGLGEFRPIADNDTESGKSQNRRVDIYLVPRGSLVEATARAESSRGSEISTRRSAP